MKKPVIILADPQEEYLETLEFLLLEMSSGEIDLRIISDSQLYRKLTDTPLQADLFVVGEPWDRVPLVKAQIRNKMILCEHQEEAEEEVPHVDNAGGQTGAGIPVTRMNRYTNPKGIVNTILSLARTDEEGHSEKERTTVIGVCSASGGSGCTTLAVSLAASLASLHKRTLFLSFDDNPGYLLFLKNKSTLPSDGYGIFRKKDLNWFYETRRFIRKEGFEYYPPLPGTAQSLQIPETIWQVLLRQARDSHEYEYIVADLGKALNQNAADGIEDCESVIIAALQDRMYAVKNAYMLHAMDFTDTEKFRYVCCRFDSAKENYLISPEYHPVSISGNIPEIEEASDLSRLMNSNEIREIAYLFI